ncbi:DUF7065 domain-containing protein [Streptomyces flaveolus]|uniref:DUF7065 domain-containing protein n=1 Tax=Streptomyces flaveolus TaxID=67297 RepID=UPI00381E8CD7
MTATGQAPLPSFGVNDDRLHAPGEKHSWTETSWWSFNVPERALAGWLYVQVRPHQHTTAGGAFLYDATSPLPWQLPYYAMFDHQRLPADFDLTHARLPSGVSIDCVEPGMVYNLGYRFRDETDLVASLRFEGLIRPFPYLSGTPPFSASSHFDQPGRLTGTLQLRGERIEVDCFSLRDRSWGPRPEHWGRGGRMSYVFATMDARNGLLAFCHPVGDDPFTDTETVTTGYLLKDGEVSRLTGGSRTSTRDPRTRMVRTIDVDLHDELGRTVHAHGDARSAMVLSRHRVTFNTLLEWTDSAGRVGWGEDQDLWPVALLADSARSHSQ